MNLSAIALNLPNHHPRSAAHTAIIALHPNLASAPMSPLFASALINEIRNPLININLSVQVVKNLTNNKDLMAYMDMISRSSLQIGEIVNDLVSFQHPVRSDHEQYSVRFLLEEILDDHKDQIVQRFIKVRRNYSLLDPKRYADRPMLKKGLSNIIIKIIESMPEKGAILEVSTRRLRGTYYIVISNNGKAILEDELNGLFDPFYFNDQIGREHGLTGAMSHLSGGHIGIHIRSDVLVGNRFILTYKMKDDTPAEPSAR